MAVLERHSFDRGLLLAGPDAAGASPWSGTVTEVGEVAGTDASLDLNDFIGNPVAIYITVEATDNTTADETYQIDVESSASSTFASGVVSEKEITITAGIVAADNSVFKGVFEPQERYIRIQMVSGGTTPIFTNISVWVAPVF